VSVFLAPTSNKTIDLKLVRDVANVESIRAYDWCAYIFREMVNSIKDEKKTGSLGNAPLSKIDYPISLQQQDKPEAVSGTQNSDKGLDEELEEEFDEECESKEGYLMVKLPKGVESDKQIKARSIDGPHEIYLRMKRDNELFFSRYVNNMTKLATEDIAAEKVVVNNEENPSAKQAPALAPAPSLSQTQPALRDPDYHTFIDGLYKELNKKYGGCFDRDLLSDDDLECADEENDEEFDVTNLNSDDGGEAEKRNDEEECFDNFVTNIVLGVTSNIEHMYEDTNVVNQKDDVESNVDLGVTGAAEDSLGDPKVVSNVDFGENVPDEGNQNRDFDDGKPDDSNISAQRCISKKEVMDYCFLNDHRFDKTEIVCNFGIYHNTTKKDIESLLPNTIIEAIVIESWAIMLNKMQMEGSGSTRPRRIFYGIAHSIVVEKMIDIDHDYEDDGEMKKYRA
ncbi:hypothetical protein KSS87_010345, partial [Heliosperma pusillum]